MDLLREVSKVVEQVSVDEAYVDLGAAELPEKSPDAVQALVTGLLARITEETGGLTASAGVATSKMMAKLASEMDKPGGLTVIPPGSETRVLHPLPVRAVAGVGPATAARLHGFGVETVGDLERVSLADLVAIFGQAHGQGLHRLARALDERAVVTERETKSVSVEETFETDIADQNRLGHELDDLSRRLAARLGTAALFGRTITVKARRHDFTTLTRSGTLPHATGEAGVIVREARRLLGTVDTSTGLRLLGVGVSGLTDHAQEELMLEQLAGLTRVGPDRSDASSRGDWDHPPGNPADSQAAQAESSDGWMAIIERRAAGWHTGQDVRHTERGPGWVWGTGRGLVTVRFEGPLTAPGPIRTYAADDPGLSHADPPDWRPSGEERGPAA
jgi:DNA polymerase-4